ncbi:MAG: hypothetical protein PHG25_02070 [Candidatus Pacebacteria bacterium]|nr:hypothetical protein [Candidatus Paceibacterota bacterium]
MRKNLYNRGQVIILNTILFLAVSLLLINGVAYPILSHYTATQGLIQSKQSFLLADSATNEALYRLKNNLTIGSTETITLASSSATIIVTNTPSGKRVAITSPGNTYQRNIQLDLTLGTGVSFHYGIQSGQGGFVLQNNSTVTGNVFSSGTVVGNGNTIYGDVISAGSSGLISGIYATGTIYAHTLQNSRAGKDAFYYSAATIDSYTGSHVTGIKYPNSTDQTPVDLPIDDAQITEWENDAAASGTATCSGGTYTITSSVIIGPIKIPCDLVISGSPTVTIKGHIWVTGNITIQNNSILKMDSSLGAQNVAIIADDPTNRLTGSLISIQNNAAFQNSGTTGSFVFMISQNNSAENGGSVNAITLSNNTTALVAYAAHGLIPLSNNISLKEVTAYKITLQNNANVIYDTGLPNTLFQAGPGGGYNVLNWTEI